MTGKNAVIAATVIALGAATVAYARNHGNDAISGLGHARISLTQAIATAERHAGGQATKAELERHEGRGVFEVEVVKGNTVSNLSIDASDGKVLAARPDRDDPHSKECDDD